MRIAVIAITRGGALLAQRLGGNSTELELYISSRYTCHVGCQHNSFEANGLKSLIATLWKKFDGFVMIMATGIVVRMIAPLLKSKETDPAIVVMDDAGQFSISLLSGHLGGANELARRCALATGAKEIITTATDANNLPSFDLLAKKYGWVIEDINRVKTLNANLLDNLAIAVADSTGKTSTWLNGSDNISFFTTTAEAANSTASAFLFVTNQLLPEQISRENVLILRPRNLVLGIGCNRGTTADEIEAFVTTHLAQLSLSRKSVCCIASVAAKRDEVGLIEFAKRLGVPLRCFESDELNRVTFPSPPSEHALAAVGVAGVAEPAAILASGGGELLLKKVKSQNVTLAIAELKIYDHNEME